ncbi:endothelin-converting enzyme 1-like [Amblyomma americanum]
MALIVIAFCVLLTIVLLVTVPQDKHQIVCTSTPCAALDALLEDSVDRRKDACSDFYAYVCHGWAHSQNVSVYRSHVQRFLARIDQILGHVTVRAQGEQKAEQAVVAVYKTCMSVLEGGADELPAFRDHLKRVGVSWPSVSPQPNLVLTAVRVYAHFGITAVLRIRRIIQSAASDMLEVAPDQGFLGTWKTTRDRLLLDGGYKRLFEETKIIFSGSNSGGPAQEVLRYDQFVEIEEFILTNVAAEQLSGNITFLRSVDSLAAVTKNIDEESWRAAAKMLRLSTLAQVHVLDLNYVKRVDKVVKMVGSQHFHYYAGWCVVQLMRRYIDKALARSWYDHDDDTSVMFDSDKQRSQADCVQLVESLVGPLTFRRFMLWSGNSSQPKLSSMKAVILKQLKKEIERAQIYGPAEHYFHASDYRDLTEDPLKVLDKVFGSEWNLSNSSSLLSNWMDVAAAVSIVNATFRDLISTTYVKDLVTKEQYSLFDDRKGTVSFPPMYAMLPVYDQHLSDAANFGALGTLFATASLRTFLARLPAESPAFGEALRKMGCFADAAAIRSDKGEPYHTAAAAGVALDALRHLPKPDRLRLQLFNKLQTFFVLMCYLLCVPHTSENTEYAQVTCNEAVKNNADFPAAFECPSGSPMNPARRCNFF